MAATARRQAGCRRSPRRQRVYARSTGQRADNAARPAASVRTAPTMARMSTFAAVDPPLDGAAGGIPFLPPLGESRGVPATAGTLARLAGDLAVAMTVETAEVEAMLVFVDRDPVVAVARRGSLVTTDQDALETVAEVPMEGLRFFSVDPALARVLGAYFLPTVVDDLPVATVAAETLIRSFGKPGQRACVIVRAAGDLGLAFLDGDADPACMTSGGEPAAWPCWRPCCQSRAPG